MKAGSFFGLTVIVPMFAFRESSARSSANFTMVVNSRSPRSTSLNVWLVSLVTSSSIVIAGLIPKPQTYLLLP